MWGLGLHLGSRAGGLRAFLGQRGLVAELVETALGFFHTPPHPLLPTKRRAQPPFSPTDWKWEKIVLKLPSTLSLPL